MDIYKVNDLTELLQDNPYPGRGIIMGETPDGKHAVAAYFIMGRSANSRNRIFVKRDGALFTEPFDASKVEDPSLIIYAAARDWGNSFVVTNGDQTDTIVEGLQKGALWHVALAVRTFEPDAPNFTPRISAVQNFLEDRFYYQMSILKSVDAEGSGCARQAFGYPPRPGVGHFIHTYVTDGNPIPSFVGEPERVAMLDDIDAFTDKLWNALNADNKISLFVRYTDLKTRETEERIVNKNQ